MPSDLFRTGLCSLTQGLPGTQNYLASVFRMQALGPPPQPMRSEFPEGRSVLCTLNTDSRRSPLRRASRSVGLPGARLPALAEGPEHPRSPGPLPGWRRGPAPAERLGESTCGQGAGLGRDRASRRQAAPTASHLYTSDPELGKGSAHLGGSCRVVLAVGDDFDEQGVIVWGDDSPLEGRRVIQADAHALSAPEHLGMGVSRVRNRVGSGSPDAAPSPGWTPALAGEVLPHFHQRGQGHPAFSGCHTVTASFPRGAGRGGGKKRHRGGPAWPAPGP